jgi:hypothetical protein
VDRYSRPVHSNIEATSALLLFAALSLIDQRLGSVSRFTAPAKFLASAHRRAKYDLKVVQSIYARYPRFQ